MGNQRDLVFFSLAGYSCPMARAANPNTPDIKVTPESYEKDAFIKASVAARQSLSQWMIAAAVKAAAEQGFPVKPPTQKKRAR